MIICILQTGRVAMEHFGAYAVSKSATEMYSDVLRLEMKKWDVRVCIIEPQGYRTGLCHLFLCCAHCAINPFVVICEA